MANDVMANDDSMRKLNAISEMTIVTLYDVTIRAWNATANGLIIQWPMAQYPAPYCENSILASNGWLVIGGCL